LRREAILAYPSGMRISRPWILAAAAASAAACKSERSEPAPVRAGSAAAVPTGDDARFVIATPAITTRDRPARFAAPLPASIDEARRTEAYPPHAYLVTAIAHGTGDVRQRLIAAVARAAASGPIDDELADWYAGLFGYAPDADTCEWIVMATAAAKVPAVQRAFFGALTRCGDVAAPIMRRPETPDAIVVEWAFEYDAFEQGAFEYHARIAAAAVAVATTAEDLGDVRKVGFVLARLGPEGIPIARRLQTSLRDPQRRAIALLGMLHSSEPAGRALGLPSCKELPSDAMCSSDPLEPLPELTLDDLVRTAERPALRSYPAPDRLAAATRCLADDGPEVCYVHLAAVDRSAAVAHAKRELGRAPRPDADAPLAARALVAFPDAGALEAELERLGFSQRGPRRPLTGVSVDTELDARGRLLRFDSETDQFPNEHDGLLAELAVLAAPALDDVVFTEDAPPETEMDTGAYWLTAYADGRAYRLRAENLGDWYDVNAVIGLLNAVLVAKGSPLRYAVLPTGDQTAIVTAGPGASLTSLVDRGLLELAGADDARASGKAFEDEAIEHLKASGADPIYRDVPLVPGTGSTP
jgi:hypothetical protein